MNNRLSKITADIYLNVSTYGKQETPTMEEEELDAAEKDMQKRKSKLQIAFYDIRERFLKEAEIDTRNIMQDNGIAEEQSRRIAEASAQKKIEHAHNTLQNALKRISDTFQKEIRAIATHYHSEQ